MSEPRDADSSLVAMSVVGLALDPLTQMPIVLLQDVHKERTLPIWIGATEASAIAALLEKVPLTRPMTHDLFHSVLEALGARVERAELTELREGTFYALVHLVRGEERFALDARPSDALAMALRAGAPIWVSPQVLASARQVELAPEAETDGAAMAAPASLAEEDRERWAELFEKLSPGQFGKYKM